MTSNNAAPLARWTAAALVSIVCAAVLAISHPGRWPALAACAAVLLVAAVWTAAGRRPLLEPFRNWPAAVFALAAIWAAIQVAGGQTEDRYATVEKALLYGACMALFCVSTQVFGSAGTRRRIRIALTLFGLVLSTISVVQLYTSEDKIFWLFLVAYKGMIMGPFVSRDHFACFIELLLPLAVFELVRSRERQWLHAAAAAAMFASVIAGASRAGAVLVTIEMAVLLAFVPRLGTARGSGRRVLGASALAVVFTLVFGWQFLWNRLRDSDPYRGRREMLASAVRMAGERPWTGFGLGAFETVYPAYALFDNGARVDHAHNDWAEWAAEGGVPFLLLLASLAVWAVRQSLAAPWLAGVAAVFVHALVDFPMQKPPLLLLTVLLLGMSAAARNEARIAASRPEQGCETREKPGRCAALRQFAALPVGANPPQRNHSGFTPQPAQSIPGT